MGPAQRHGPQDPNSAGQVRAGDSPIERDSWELPGVPSARRPAAHGWEEGNTESRATTEPAHSGGEEGFGLAFSRDCRKLDVQNVRLDPEMRAATPPETLQAMWAWTGVWERGAGSGQHQTSPHHQSQEARSTDPRGRESQRQSGSSSRKTLEGQSGLQKASPLHPSSLGSWPGMATAWGICVHQRATWVLGEEEQHMLTSRGGPQGNRPPRWYTRVRHWLQRGCLTI